MWQRVQTLYLFISTVLIGLMFFLNKSVIPGAEPGELLAEVRYTAYWPYVVLLVVICLLNILALTTFRFRVFQMRTAVLSAIITLALQAWLVVDFVMTHGEYVFRMSAVFPIVSVICDMMAARAILSDQMVVESVSRLRSGHKKGSAKR